MKNPEKTNISEILNGGHQYVAPVFQRYYVWGKEELNVLIDDIVNATDESSIQFIGATVLQDMGKKGGVNSPTEYLMVDGQQRLTTLYLMLCGIAWIYRLKNKIDEATTLVETYLAFNAGSLKGVPKLIPTTQDRKQLYDILNTDVGSVDWNFKTHPADSSSKRSKISEQWIRIKDYLESECLNSAGHFQTKKVEILTQKLLGNVEVVQITLDTTDDANSVFSKLNYMGVDLSAADLVRNDVFSRFSASEMNKAQKFYKEKWSPFEKSFPKDSFSTYIPIYSLIKFKGNCSKSQAFPKLQESWKKNTPDQILKDLETYSEAFQLLVDFTEDNSSIKDKKINKAILKMSKMPKTTVTWPYLIQLIHAISNSKISKIQFEKALLVVESFLVRRAINGLEPTGLHAVFKGLWPKVGVDLNKLKEKIVTATIKSPLDNHLLESFSDDDMYKRSITKYLFLCKEIDLAEKNGYDLATDDFSIEHVMPKNRIGQWATDFTQEEHKSLLNCIGNLIPLTIKQNSDVKDQDWSKKKKSFEGSNWKFSLLAAKSKKWNKQTIQNRTKDFSTWACQRWPEISTIN